MKLCKSTKDIPSVPHFAVILFNTMSVIVWEEPEPVVVSEYYSFDSEQEWKNWIQSKEYEFNKTCVAIKVTPAKVNFKVSVDIN